MASVRPETNNTHSLGTSSFKWSALHTVDVQTDTLTTSGNVEIGGNLTVLGTATTIDVQTLAVEDALISLARNNAADAVDIGFYGRIVDGETTKYVGLYRDADDGKFKFFEGLTSEPSTTVPAGGSLATIQANIEGTITGNSDTADALSTARTIALSGDVVGSVSFDGSANVDIDSTIQAGAVENSMLANSAITFGDGVTSEAIALGQSIGFEGTLQEVEVVYNSATNTFTFGLPDTITADLNGNATSADALSTARTLSLSGDVSGSVSFDGSANVDIDATIGVGAVENSMLANSSITIGDGVTSEAIALGDAFSIEGTASEVEVAYSAATNSFSIGLPDTIVADVTGTASNASQATKLTTARTIALSGDVAGSIAFDGTANVSIDSTIQAGAVENSMLANSAITFSDGTASDVTALGESLNIIGTANEVEVALDAGSSTFQVGLPDTIVADLSGNATSADAWSSARTIALTGAVTGSASVDGSSNVDISTTIADGSLANAKLVNSSITMGDGVTSEAIALGDSITIEGTASEVEVAYSAATNTFSVGLPDTIVADLTGTASDATQAAKLTTARTLSVSGDVVGSVSFDGSANVDIDATIQAGAVENSMLANSAITFGDGTASESISLGQALVLAGTAGEVDVAYNATTNTFSFGLPDTITANVSGNATSADAWSTARTITLGGDLSGNVSIDGSQNVTLNATIQSGTALTFGDGVTTEDIGLGEAISFVGTANELEVAYSAATNTFTFGLPDTITADLSGNASSADTALQLTNARTLSVSGDATGSASFDGTANADIALTISAGAVENSMLANSSITFSDGVATDITALGESLNIIGTANEVSVELDAGSSTFQVGLPADVSGLTSLSATSLAGELTGNASTATKLATARTLSVSGDATGSVSFDGSANADIELTLTNDSITFSDGTASDVTLLGESLTLEGTANEVTVALDAGTSTFTFGLPDTIVADLTGTASDASQATKLTNARTLSVSGDATGSASFDGTANADIALTISAGAVENSMLANSTLGFGDGAGIPSQLALGSSLTFEGTLNEVDVAWNDVDSKFTFGLPDTIVADVTGNADTASALATARTLSVSGDATGSVSFDGSANADIALTISAGAVENSMLANSSITFSDGAASDVTALGESLNIIGTANEIEVALDAGTSTFQVGLPSTITADVSGNASTASALATARTLSISGDATGSASFDGSANADIALTIATGAVENSMLANSSITVGDGTSGEAIALGQSFNIVGTANEVDVAYSTLNNRFTIGLPADVDIANDLDVGANLSVTSALTVTGNALFTSNLTATSANIKLGDTMLEMGLNNEVSSDHGFFSQRNVNSYTGIFFDETDDYWKVFTDTSKPGTTVDTAAGSYAEGNMKVAAFKAESVEVNGAYSLPTADGSNGQVLTTDGAGNVSFATPSAPSSVAAFTVVTGNTTITTGSEPEQVVLENSTSALAHTLPSAATAGEGYSLTVKNGGTTGTSSLTRAGSDVIYVNTGSSPNFISVAPLAWVRLVSNGVDTWYVIEN